nr:MAG TPA: hypothetical protein [Caudoviricetes sp.]
MLGYTDHYRSPSVKSFCNDLLVFGLLIPFLTELGWVLTAF